MHELESLCLSHDLGVDARQCKCARETIGDARKALIKGAARRRRNDA
jgi:hypothetical protein